MAEEPQQYDVFQAIADPTRRRLLELLASEELSISTISSHFTMSRTAVTKHLHVLESAGLVDCTKKWVVKSYIVWKLSRCKNCKHGLPSMDSFGTTNFQHLKMLLKTI